MKARNHVSHVTTARQGKTTTNDTRYEMRAMRFFSFQQNSLHTTTKRFQLNLCVWFGLISRTRKCKSKINAQPRNDKKWEVKIRHARTRNLKIHADLGSIVWIHYFWMIDVCVSVGQSACVLNLVSLKFSSDCRTPIRCHSAFHAIIQFVEPRTQQWNDSFTTSRLFSVLWLPHTRIFR